MKDNAGQQSNPAAIRPLIQQGSRVKLNFSLALEEGDNNGVEIDSNFNAEPVELLVGGGDMLPGFESVLLGLGAGDSVEQLIGHENAFGASNPDNLQRFKKDTFDASIDLAIGLVVSFADPAGGELPGIVRTIETDCVEVDFNHPLAGKNILFRAQIHEVLN